MSAEHSSSHLEDGEHLAVLGYEDSFNRSMTFWANFALGFTYLSPLVGVYSLFAVALATGGPPSIWWIVIVGAGQLLVSLVFGEVVSQYPIHGGIYPWARRLWGRRYAWMAAWIYVWAMIVTITAVAEYGSGFLASLFGLEATKEVTLGLTVLLLVVALALNFTGTKTLATVARIGLAAELIGVIAVGIYLLIFERKQPFSVFFDTMGVQGDGSYVAAFLGAALAGLFLFYGFEACGDVAEEVANPARRIPKAISRDHHEERRLVVLQIRQRAAPGAREHDFPAVQDGERHVETGRHRVSHPSRPDRPKGERRQVGEHQSHEHAAQGAHTIVLAHEGDESEGIPRNDGAAHELVQQHALRGQGRQLRLLPRELHPEARHKVRLVAPCRWQQSRD